MYMRDMQKSRFGHDEYILTLKLSGYKIEGSFRVPLIDAYH